MAEVSTYTSYVEILDKPGVIIFHFSFAVPHRVKSCVLDSLLEGNGVPCLTSGHCCLTFNK